MAKAQRDRRQSGSQTVFPLDRLAGPVEEAIQEVENPDLVREQRAILDRMTTDKRMKNVWNLLLSRKRPSREFVYPAIQRTKTSKSDNERQFDAIRELFYCVFCFARDKMRVSRPTEIKQSKTELVRNAKTLRQVANDLDLAATHGQLGVVTVQDKLQAADNVLALRLVANWLDHLSGILRKPGDPLLVKRHRGDSVVRGVQILVAGKIEELFGDRLDGTTATLTSVALGTKTSTKITRSAFKTKNPKKRA